MIHDVNIGRIVVSNKVSFDKKSFKYFAEYEDDSEQNVPLCMMLSKVSAYRRDFEGTKYMSFLIKDNKMLKKLMKFGSKSAILLKKVFTKTLYATINIWKLK